MRLFLIVIISLINIIKPSLTFSQCMMYPLSLSKRVVNARTIIQGKVIESTPYLSASGQIYTSNLVQVNAYLKGYSHLKKIFVISEGGVLESFAQTVHPSLDLDMQHEVILLLIGDNTTIDNKQFRVTYPDIPQMEAYGCTQGKFIYQDGLYHDLLSETPFSEEALFYRISAISGLSALTPEGTFYMPRKYSALPVVKSTISISKIAAVTGATPNPGIAGTINAADQVTISGVGFGAAPGTVEFSNADDGGATMIFSPVPTTDIISWSDVQIVMKVPRQAGTGSIKINGNAGFTTAYAVTYSHLEINNIGAGFASSTRQRFYLVNKDGLGGYTFQYNTTFAANLPAVAAFERALATWRCNTFVNFSVSATNTATASAANDGVNAIFFDATLPAGVLGQALSSYSGASSGGCTLQNTEWYTADIDVRFSNPPFAGYTWNYGPGTSVAFATTYDFESVALHELGHAHGLGHIIAPGTVMHYALLNGADARTLNAGADLAGGLAKMAYTTVAANYCIKYPAGVTGPIIALTGGNCALPVSLLSFTGKRIGANHNLLEWETDLETNNGGFELQRSNDGLNFYTIANIGPKGGSRRSYSYDDYSDESTVYYKLIQIDLNGVKTSFPVVMIENVGGNSVLMFFDPGDKVINATFSKAIDVDSEWILYNVTGQIVRREKIQKDSYQKILFVGDLSSGVYTYFISSNGVSLRGKMPVQQAW